jgi:hypothetical protein
MRQYTTGAIAGRRREQACFSVGASDREDL